MSNTLYWHDYETFGINPAVDRPSQFAGLRTDENLNEIGDPLVIYCKPADDFLPHPMACFITGITPQIAREKGIAETEFAQKINAELTHSGTCGVGYNSMRFDDEVSRYLFYRNFIDPYAREWQGGNSRWDLIDTVRLTHALRPDGIEWPKNENGTTSFRLELLTQANGIEHAAAHDALSDVRATIALAQLVRQHQPKLYAYAYDNRRKKAVSAQLNLFKPQMLLHVSARIPAAMGCIAPIWPLALHPTNPNGVLVFDLRQSPQALFDLDVDALKKNLFTPANERDEETERLRIKAVHINKSPVLVPLSTLTDKAAECWQIDRELIVKHRDELINGPDIRGKLQQVFDIVHEGQVDSDSALYSGGFFSNHDRREMSRITQTPVADLPSSPFKFQDKRLPEMLFRYRARNYPDSLSSEEQAEWQKFRADRLQKADSPGLGLADFKLEIDTIRQQQTLTDEKQQLLIQLERYADELVATLD